MGWETIGSIIHVNKGVTTADPLFLHEYGHYKQSQIIGWLYLPLVGVPSLYSSIIHDYDGHKGFWTEQWSDYLMRSKSYIQKESVDVPKLDVKINKIDILPAVPTVHEIYRPIPDGRWY